MNDKKYLSAKENEMANANDEIVAINCNGVSAMGVARATRYFQSTQNNLSGYYDTSEEIGTNETVRTIVPEVDVRTELARFADSKYTEEKVLEVGVATGTYYIWSNVEDYFAIEVEYSILTADGMGERFIGRSFEQTESMISPNKPTVISVKIPVSEYLAPGEQLIHRINVRTSSPGQEIYLAFGGTDRPSGFIVPIVANHNYLDGLQGGTDGEYYHLTMDQHNKNLLADGDGSNLSNTFVEASIRENLTSGERLSESLGKQMKWFSDLKSVAWSGNASDLAEDESNMLVTDEEKTTWNGKLDKSGGTMTGDLNMNGNTINGVDGLNVESGYLTIGSFAEGTYGVGTTKIWHNPNENELNFMAVDENNISAPVKLVATGFDTNNGKIINLPNGSNPTDAVNKSQLDTKLDKSGGEITGNLTIPHGTKIKGTGTGDANTSRLDFMESDNTTRRGYVGDGGSDDRFFVWSDKGDITLGVPDDKDVNVYTDGAYHKIWHAGNDGTGSGLDADLLDGKGSGSYSRTLLSNGDIGYNDTIFADVPVQDILLDIFTKAQILIGSDKPFEVTFLCQGSSTNYLPNIGNAIKKLIKDEYGTTIDPTIMLSFKLEAGVANSATSPSYASVNKCSVFSKDYYFEWEFDYDAWSNVIVYDREGFVWDKNKPVTLAANIPCASDSCSFSDNAWLYDWIVATSGSQGLSDVIIWIKVVGGVTSNLGGNYTRATTSSASPGMQTFYIGGTLDNSGTLFSKPSGTSSLGGYVSFFDNAVPHTSDNGATFNFYGIGKRSAASRTS